MRWTEHLSGLLVCTAFAAIVSGNLLALWWGIQLHAHIGKWDPIFGFMFDMLYVCMICFNGCQGFETPEGARQLGYIVVGTPLARAVIALLGCWWYSINESPIGGLMASVSMILLVFGLAIGILGVMVIGAAVLTILALPCIIGGLCIERWGPKPDPEAHVELVEV